MQRNDSGVGNIKGCKENRDGWRELAEIIQEKNQRVISLLGLLAQAPEQYAAGLEHANKYQKILNAIASDMKKETETEAERGSGLESYWERMKLRGREAALSEINAKKIADYKDCLRDQALDTMEVVGIHVISEINQINKRLDEHVQPNPSSPRKMPFKPRPPLVEGFIGRGDVLEAMRRTHLEAAPTRRATPRLTVLTGLGGSGKTQIALKFTSEFEERYQHRFIYFLDASSKEVLETDLKTLVQSQSDVYTDALIWLANTPMDWLIIMDNADDPSLELAPFLPRCSHGHVIITSRNRFRTTLSPESTHYIDSLPLDEAANLLLNMSKYKDNSRNKQLAIDIAEELGRLPLALAHAGAYIFLQQCLGTYLATYRANRFQLLRRKVDMPQDYPYSVAATVETSFEKLSPQVRDLLGLLSHLDARSISRGIIEKAASRRFRHIAVDSGLPSRTETM